MSQMYRFSETSAVHFRIEYYQNQGKDREEALEYEGCYGGASPPYSCHHRGSEYGLCKSECGSCRLGCKTQEAYVEKREILVHNQPGSDRIKKLQDAGNEEDEACDEAAESFQSLEYICHNYFLTALSMISFTFANIAPGGSISPYSSEQSILMNFGSSSHCL